MCILFLHINSHPAPGSYRLILASNRDEYYVRNAAAASKWSDDPCIISGMDLEPGREGGTWLGLSVRRATNDQEAAVRVAALLNKTGEPRSPGAPGRGSIVIDYLKNTHISPKEYVNQLKSGEKKFNAFNFIALEISENHMESLHYSNVGELVQEYKDGEVLAFGNSSPQHPLSKVTAGKARFHHIVNCYGQVAQQEQLIHQLLELLKWEKRHLPDAELERRAPQTYQYLSSVFVRFLTAGYGTRTHTLILVDWQGRVNYVEHTMQSPVEPDKPLWLQNEFSAHL